MTYAVEAWTHHEWWEQIDIIFRRFYKFIFVVPRCKTNDMAEVKLFSNSRRHKIMIIYVMHFSTSSCSILSLNSKYSYHPVLCHPQSIFVSQGE